MARLLSVVVMAGVVLIAGSAVMSTAFTTTTVERDATFNVERDSQGIIEIREGKAGGATNTTDNTLEITLSDLNKNANFTYGDVNTPQNSHVFKFTNTDTTTYDFEVGLRNFAGDVDFYVQFENHGVDSVSGGGTTGTYDLAQGESAWVAIQIKDTGASGSADGKVYINATKP